MVVDGIVSVGSVDVCIKAVVSVVVVNSVVVVVVVVVVDNVEGIVELWYVFFLEIFLLLCLQWLFSR